MGKSDLLGRETGDQRFKKLSDGLKKFHAMKPSKKPMKKPVKKPNKGSNKYLVN